MSTVLITGASSGLGRELAMLYARGGHDLVLVARRKELLEQLKTKIKSISLSRVTVIPADLGRPEAPQEIFCRLKECGIEVSVLVNNAGMGLYGEFLKAELDAIRTMYQVNLLAPMALMRLFLPGMIARKEGQVINVASLGAFFPGPLMASYFAAKADLYSQTMAIAHELKNTSVLLTLACPGPFKSGFQQTAFGPERNKMNEHYLPSALVTARQIYRGVVRQQRLIVPGFKNKMIYWFSRVLPRTWMIALVYRAQRQLDIPSAFVPADR